MDDIPNPIRSFVREHIDSVGMLELLLVLEADPRRAWSAAELSAELRIHRDGVASQLDRLCHQGLVARERSAEPRFRYAAAGPQTRSTVAQLRRTLETRRVRLTAFLHGGRRTGCSHPHTDGD